jgi:RHS repeat-associated protein
MYYYEMDETGSVAAVWNTSNSMVATYTYDPYGYTVASSGSLTQNLRWKGAQYDTVTGLYYMRARYYDPTVGRFISEDPAGLAAGINPYSYADGDPVNGSDPTGLDGKCLAPALVFVPDPTGVGGSWHCTEAVLSTVTVFGRSYGALMDALANIANFNALAQGTYVLSEGQYISTGGGASDGAKPGAPAGPSWKDCLGQAWHKEGAAVIADGVDLAVSIAVPELSEEMSSADVGKVVANIAAPLVVGSAQLGVAGAKHDGIAVGSAVVAMPFHIYESAAESAAWKYAEHLPGISMVWSGTMLLRDFWNGGVEAMKCRAGGG